MSIINEERSSFGYRRRINQGTRTDEHRVPQTPRYHLELRCTEQMSLAATTRTQDHTKTDSALSEIGGGLYGAHIGRQHRKRCEAISKWSYPAFNLMPISPRDLGTAKRSFMRPVHQCNHAVQKGPIPQNFLDSSLIVPVEERLVKGQS